MSPIVKGRIDMRCATFLMLIVLAVGSAAAQDLVLEARITADGTSCEPRLFGWRDGALDGVDVHDVPEPPLPPEGTLSLCFTRTDLSPTRWFADMRSPSCMDDDAERWVVTLQGDSSESTCVIDVEAATGDAQPYVLVVTGVGIEALRLTIPAQFSVDPATVFDDLLFELVPRSTATVEEDWGGLKKRFR